MITLDLSILNQKGTPMFNSDIFANRPAAGVVGRIFISTDTKVFYRDTGTTWELVGGSGSGTITGSGTAGTLTIWTSSSALGDSIVTQSGSTIEIKATGSNDSILNIDTTTGDYSRIELQNAGNLRSRIYFREATNQLSIGTYNTGGSVEIEVDNNITAALFDSAKNGTFYGYVSAVPTLTAANNSSSLASFGINTLSYAAGFSSNNIGALYGGMAGFNLQTFAGSATFAQANVASGGASVNSIDFSSAGSTITMTQSSGIRVMSGQQNLFQYQGTNSGTITHAAISQNTGFYRPTAATGILTITNAYSHLINALDDYGAGFTFTNRWGIYQAGGSDINYFAASVLIGTNVFAGFKLDVNGTTNFTGASTINGNLLNTNSNFQTYGSTSFVASTWGLIIGNGGASANYYKANDHYFQNGSGTQGLYLDPLGNSTFVGQLNISYASFPEQRITDGTIQYQMYSSTGSNEFVIGTISNSKLVFRTNSNERIQISADGNFLINTTSNPGNKLYLNGSLRIDGQSSPTSGGNSGQHLIINLDGTTYKIKLELP